jgi:hypothetical protein
MTEYEKQSLLLQATALQLQMQLLSGMNQLIMKPLNHNVPAEVWMDGYETFVKNYGLQMEIATEVHRSTFALLGLKSREAS